MGHNNDESAVLKRELLGLFGHMQKIRKELAALSDPDEPDRFASMAQQLDAIVEATESASNTIMENCEGIEAQIEKSRDLTKDEGLNTCFDDVGQHVNNIYESCAFQDISGQRVTKVAKTLKFVEERINAIILAWGQDELSRVVNEYKESFAEDPDKKLLHGPALKGEGVDQSAVDKIMAQSDIDKLFG